MPEKESCQKKSQFTGYIQHFDIFEMVIIKALNSATIYIYIGTPAA
jgi:hypothetical protein